MLQAVERHPQSLHLRRIQVVHNDARDILEAERLRREQREDTVDDFTLKARDNLDIHGLRHSRGVELALAGASDAETISQLEHATDRITKIYRAQADRRKLAGS